MTPFTPKIPRLQNPEQFKNELHELACPTFFNRYLIVEKDGKLKNTHVFRVFIEIVKGALGLRNGADETFVKYKALKYLLKFKKEIQADRTPLKLIKTAAERTGLTSLKEPFHNKGKDREETNKLIQKINAKLIDFNKEEADSLLADFYIHYKEELTPFSKEIGNKILNLANQSFHQKTQTENSRPFDSFEGKKIKENKDLSPNSDLLIIKNPPQQENRQIKNAKILTEETTPNANKLDSTAKKAKKFAILIIGGGIAIAIGCLLYKTYSNLCPFDDIRSGAEALNHYKIAADKGNICAQNALGHAYAFGEGVEQNDQEAEKYWEMAANQGDADARDNLANHYIRAANRGDANAQNIVGAMYATGHRVEQNGQEAVRFFMMAADQGNVGAHYALIHMYESGQAVEENEKKSKMYRYKLDAEGGFSIAQFELGLMYKNGEGVEQDDQKAARYFKMYADKIDKGVPNMDILGFLAKAYKNGDPQRAKIYYEMAAYCGDPNAQAHAQSISKGVEISGLFTGETNCNVNFEEGESRVKI